MTPRMEINDLFNILFENACTDFCHTPQYKLLLEKQNKMDLDCETMYNESELKFTHECFELLENINGEQMEFVYHKGLRDGIKLLKELGVL